MVLDSSAVIAILQNEPECRAFIGAIERDPVRLISAATVLELTMVLEGSRTSEAAIDVDEFIERTGTRIVAFDADQLSAAREAFRQFGKGRNRADLNLGDCMSYALAKVEGEPLLFKGTDFGSTDVRSVLS
jgi:ribonuclease VapC